MEEQDPKHKALTFWQEKIINMITKYLAENVTDHCKGKVERKTTVAEIGTDDLQRRGLVILNRIPRVGFTQI